MVKTTPNLGGVCQRCGSHFDSDLADPTKAMDEITTAFDAHKCMPLDASQNALRVVREATEDK